MKLWEKIALGITCTLSVVVISLIIYRDYDKPHADVVQQAAQTAVSAIVTVEHADSALAHHRLDSLTQVTFDSVHAVDSSRIARLTRTLAMMKVVTPTVTDSTIVKQWQARALALSQDLDTATAAIAAAAHADSDRVTVIVGLRADNAELAHTLQATRDTLATHRTVVIPATPTLPSLPSFKLSKILVVVAGYGAQGAKDSVGKWHVHLGPQVSVGLRLPIL